MSLRRLLAPLLLVLTLAACGPIYDTQYHFTPPADPMGRQLVGQCRMSRDMCRQNCEMREMSCKSEARSYGMREYHRYVEQRRREKAPIKRSPDSFVSDYHCSSSSCVDSCDGGYRACYVESGGTVRAQRVCTAFCDQEKPPAQTRPPAQNQQLQNRNLNQLQNQSQSQSQSQNRDQAESKPKPKPKAKPAPEDLIVDEEDDD
jgi:hypothetical protein